MINSNFLNFTKMQITALSQIVWLQLLCIALYPMFFHQITSIMILLISFLLDKNESLRWPLAFKNCYWFFFNSISSGFDSRFSTALRWG